MEATFVFFAGGFFQVENPAKFISLKSQVSDEVFGQKSMTSLQKEQHVPKFPSLLKIGEFGNFFLKSDQIFHETNFF